MIREVTLWPGGEIAAWIDCPPPAAPGPGRLSMIWPVDDQEAPLATPVFAGKLSEHGWMTGSALPAHWSPGLELELRGPLGKGFQPDPAARRIGLAACDHSAGRLLPLVDWGLSHGAAVALFADSLLPSLPSEVEIHALAALAESLDWPDYLAIDIRRNELIELPGLLGLQPERIRLGCEAEVLVATSMPCGGIGECGACSVQTRRGQRLGCQDGPVFNFRDLF